MTSTILHLQSIFLATSLLTCVALICKQENSFTFCEIPHDIPPAPPEEGTDLDINSYNPSIDPPPQSRQTHPVFTPTIFRSPSTSHSSAINFCMKRASENWVSNIPVSVKVTFASLGSANILGSAQPSRSWVVNTFICPVALAESVMNREMNAHLDGDAQYDVIMSLNADANWYTELDARPPSGMYDLVTVCLHETYHGLFLTGGNIAVSYNPSSVSYSAFFVLNNFTGRFDAFMANQDGCSIKGYKERPGDLGTVLTANNLWFAMDGRRIARLHAPRPYEAGSSLYHLSETVYGSSGDDNGLMTPAIGTAYSQHNAGELVLQMQSRVRDIGSINGSLTCDPITEPLRDDSAIEQNSGEQGEGSIVEQGGFFIRIGEGEISGWIIVGAGVGGIVALAVTAFLVHRGVRGRGKVVREGQNGGGIV